MTLPILLDVDGVLANFSAHLLSTVGSRLTDADVTQWDIFGLLEPEGLRAHALDVLKDPAWWATMPRMPGVDAPVGALLAAGADVACVTSPWSSCVGWETARREWIAALWTSNGATKSQIPTVVVTPRKDIIHGCVLVDDKPEHVEAWARTHDGAQGRTHGASYIFDAPYNRDFNPANAYAHRMPGWDEHTIDLVLSKYNREARR